MPVVTVSSCGMSFRRDVRVSESQREPRVTFLRSSMVAAATVAAAAGYRQFLSELRSTLKSSLFREILSRWKNMDWPTTTTTVEASPPLASVFNATKQMTRSFFCLFFFFNDRGDVNNICVIFAMADRGPQFVCARVREVTMRRGIFEHGAAVYPSARIVIILPLCFPRDALTTTCYNSRGKECSLVSLFERLISDDGASAAARLRNNYLLGSFLPSNSWSETLTLSRFYFIIQFLLNLEENILL